MQRYMLDTNVASYVIKRTYPALQQKLLVTPMSAICISSITEAELLFGLAKKQNPPKLTSLIHEFLLRVEILSWRSQEAQAYAELRSQIESQGLSLGNMDMLIAAHAIAVEATLVTNDRAFFKLAQLRAVDWTS